MQLLWAILVLFSLSNIVHGQAQSEAEPIVEELLIQANREIGQIPNRVEGEVDRIITKLDGLSQGQIQESFNGHYEKVEQSLKTVFLPEDVSSLEVAIKQYQALDDPSALNALIEDFIRRAESEIEPLREELVKDIDSQLDETLTAELKQAQDTIRAPFQEIVARYFPVWDAPNLRAPPLPSAQREDWSNIPLAGASGVLLVLTRQVVNQILARLSIKISGKVLGKLIPFVGFLLMVYEVWDATQAKANLEHELRTQVLSTYKKEFSPITLLNPPIEEAELSTRQRLEQHLQAWSEHCRKEAERILYAAPVFTLSPNAKDYIAEQTRKGHDTQEIVEDIHRIKEVFGQSIIVRKEPLGYLLKMIADNPEVVDVADIMNRAYQKNLEVARACLRQWPVQTWERYHDPDRLKALLDVAAYRLTERRQTAYDFAREIGERDELTPIVVDAGLDGVRIWDAHVRSAAGQHQRKMAEDAITLFKKGYPYEALQTQEGLAEAQVEAQYKESLLFRLEQALRNSNIGSMVYYGAVVLVLLTIAVLARPLLRRLLPGERSAPPPRKPEPQ